MHLLWNDSAVPAPVQALGDLLAQGAGWPRLGPRGRGTAFPDSILVDWGGEPPAPDPQFPLLWIARMNRPQWNPIPGDERPDHLRPPEELRTTDIELSLSHDETGPSLPLLRGEAPVALPRAIELGHTPQDEPVIVGLQRRDGHAPAIYIGSDVWSLILSSLSARRERTLATNGYPVAGLFERSGEPEHLVKFPWINHALGALQWCVEWLAREQSVPTVQVGRFPEGRSWAVCLSHDADYAGWRPITALKQVRHAGRKAGLALARGLSGDAVRAISEGTRLSMQRNFWAIEACLEANDALDVRSSFFFYSRSRKPGSLAAAVYDPEYDIHSPAYASTVAQAHDMGFEVGLHGSYLSHKESALMAEERERLEDCLGASIRGVRQHFLQGEAPELWRTQQRADLEYDSSWGYRDRSGFRAGVALPYHPWDPEEERTFTLWELPLIAMDGQLYDRECQTPEAVDETIDALLEQLRLAGGAGAVDWHQRFFAEPGHEWRRCYERMVSKSKDLGAWLGPCGTLIDWWRARCGLQTEVTERDGMWDWSLAFPEPLAGVRVILQGVDPATVELQEHPTVTVLPAATGVTFRIGEAGPDRPLRFRARALRS